MSGARSTDTSLLARVLQLLEVTMAPGALAQPDPSSCQAQRLASTALYQLFSAHRDLSSAEDLTKARGLGAEGRETDPADSTPGAAWQALPHLCAAFHPRTLTCMCAKLLRV